MAYLIKMPAAMLRGLDGKSYPRKLSRHLELVSDPLNEKNIT